MSRTAAGGAGRPAAYRVAVIESLDALAPHADALDALLARAAPGAGAFYRADALRAMAPVFAAGRRAPFLLLAWQGREPVALLPLVLERKPLSRAGVRRLALWGTDAGMLGVEGTVVIDPGVDPHAVLRALRTTLEGELAPRYDVLDLGYLRADAAALPALRAAFPEARERDEALPALHADLSGTLEEWRASRSRKQLRKLSQLGRRFAADHAGAVREVGTLTSAEFDAVATLHDARQRELAAAGHRRDRPFADPRTRDAIRAMLDAAARGGRARHYLLEAHGRLAAALLCLVDGPSLIAWITAADTAVARYSPGSLLFVHAVEAAFARGDVRRIDFGPGSTLIKRTVATDALVPRRFTWVRPGSVAARWRTGAWERLAAWREELARGGRGASPAPDEPADG